MKAPTDKYGITLEAGSAVYSTAVNMPCQIAEIVPPGPPMIPNEDLTAKPVQRPGKITLLFEVEIYYDDQNLAIQSLQALMVKPPLDWMRIPRARSKEKQ